MLAVVLGAVLASPYSMALLFIAVAAGSMLEFYKIARLTGAAPLQVYPTVIGVLLVAAAFAVARWIDRHSGAVIRVAVGVRTVYRRIVSQKHNAPD